MQLSTQTRLALHLGMPLALRHTTKGFAIGLLELETRETANMEDSAILKVRRLLGCQQFIHADKPVAFVLQVVEQFANSVVQFVTPAWTAAEVEQQDEPT